MSASSPIDDREPGTHRSRLFTVALYLTFALTGLSQTLPGSILPTLTAHWHLHDARAGLLFAAQFAGGAVGGLLTRTRFRLTLAIALAVIIASALLLGYADATAAYPILFCYGAGNGAAMTSISMIIGSRYTRRRGSALSLLNFFWSGGATLCPLIAARLLAIASLHAIFAWVAAIYLLLLAAIALSRDPAPAAAHAPETAPAKAPISLVLFFAVLAFLYVGIENAIGGWISTYAHRIGVSDLRQATAMATFFWGAVLVGRGLSSAVLLRLPERRLYLAALFGTAVGIALLLLAHSPVVLAAAAVLVGLALAPIFPLNLSLFMARAGELSRAGLLLAISGFGGSFVPWATGLISDKLGSLRAGLCVPWMAALVMLAMALVAVARGNGYLRLRAEPHSTDRPAIES